MATSACAIVACAVVAHLGLGPAHGQALDPVAGSVADLPTLVVRPPSAEATTGSAGALTPLDTATLPGAEAAAATLFTSDTGSLVGELPGGAAWGAGGVSSLPAVNGMGADRVQVAINGMIFSPACPNEMNPPLSFLNPAMVSTLRVYTATSPVSIGGDYTGARVEAQVAPPRFTPGPQLTTTGRVSGFYRSNGHSYGVDATATVSNQDTSVTYTGGWARASDYTSGNGTTIKSTMYETQNHALSISKQFENHLFTAEIGGQFIPSEGFVNQYMDLVENKSLFANGRYKGGFDWGELETLVFANRIRHTMGFIEPDKTGDMPMDTRSTDLGYAVKASIPLGSRDLVRLGNELDFNTLDDWWPPVAGSMMMGPDTFQSINDGQRLRVGTFGEWERRIDERWTAVIGLRNDVVWMNTGDVEGYNAMMYGADAALFNARSHARTDVNFDASALLRYEADPFSRYELSVARKTRSPNLYERYAWSTSAMAMKMIGWFGDGNGYVGNLDLEPEAAHTVSFTADWHDAAAKAWQLKVSPYSSYVVNYIDADRCARPGCLASLPSNLTTTDNFVYLQFANHDAWLYGVNIDGRLALWDSDTYGQGAFRGSLNFVQGQRTDGVNLYHMMPLNGTLALDNVLGAWTTSLELQLVSAKVLVNQVRNELQTEAYALVNFRTSYAWQMLRLDFGIENILDTPYDLPLGGANLVNDRVPNMMGGSSPAWGYAVAGPGRSFNTRVTLTF